MHYWQKHINLKFVNILIYNDLNDNGEGFWLNRVDLWWWEYCCL